MHNRISYKYATYVVGIILILMGCRLFNPTPEPTEKPSPIRPVEETEETIDVTDTPLSTDVIETPTATESLSDQVEAEADRDNVFKISVSDERQQISEGESEFLIIGEGVDVDEIGRALLNFVGDKIAFQVEVLRDGELIVQELEQEQQSVSIQLLQSGGTFLNQFDAQEEIDQRITIRTDYAEITASGTRFMVVKESNTPLEWVVGLDAVEGDLQVSAQGVVQQVVAGQTRWIAPLGGPSPGIDAQMDNVQSWLDNLVSGKTVAEIGQVVWDFADIATDMSVLYAIPAPGETVELPGGIQLGRLVDGGYAIDDCNQDSINDLVVNSGVVTLDFTSVLGRVQSLDLSVVNLSRPSSGVLRLFNPAYEEVGSVPVEVGGGQGQVVSLQSDQAVHYAKLELQEGCLLGVSTASPDSPPRSGGGLLAEITAIRLNGQIYEVDFVTFGFEPTLPGTHVHFFFNTVPPDQAGVPGRGPWILYGGSSPFTEYKLNDKPSNATQMCILVANSDHSVQANSGNCYDLPLQ